MKHEIQYKRLINGLMYQSYSEDFKDQILDFYYDVFLKDEPTTVAAGGYKERHPAIVQQVYDILDDGVSIISVDPNNNKLVGIMLSHTVDKHHLDPRGTYDEYCQTFPALHASVMTLFDEIMYPGDIFDAHSEDNKFFDMFTLATHPDYRGKGIGRTLVNESLKVGQEAGCSAAIVLATNDFSRKIFEKVGFELIQIKKWEDCIYNGKPAFGNVPSKFASAHYLKL